MESKAGGGRVRGFPLVQYVHCNPLRSRLRKTYGMRSGGDARWVPLSYAPVLFGRSLPQN